MRIVLRVTVNSDPDELKALKAALEPDFSDWDIKLNDSSLTFIKEEKSPSRAKALSVSLFRAIELFYSVRRLKDNL